MLRRMVMVSCLGLCLATGATTAVAEQTGMPQGLAVRGGVIGGVYEFHQDGYSASSGDSYGLLGGVGYQLGPIFVDFALERTHNDSAQALPFNRTDAVLTAGWDFMDRFSAFGGYRLGWQSVDQAAVFGSGLFNEQLYSESGYVVGLVASLMRIGKLSSAVSVAYNRSKLDNGSASRPADDDQDGFSAKLGLTVSGTPHGFFLRWQRFMFENNNTDENGDPLSDYKEDYVHLIYQYSWVKAW